MEEEIMTQERDRISQLPEHVKDQILQRLPIKDLVRTSILSRKWRNKWCSVPRLEFDDQCMRSVRGTLCQQDLVKIIDRVLLLHTGPIQTFVLSLKKFLATSDIDPWILHLSRVSITGIALYIYTWHKYKIPTSLVNCQDLISLKLRGCSVKIPSSFEGFKKLTTLYLHRVELSPCGLEAMISRCPILKHLNLKNLEGTTGVNLEAARNLQSLVIGGAFLEVTFDVLNRLRSVTEGFDHNIKNRHGNANSSNLPKFFRGIPNIQILKIESYSLKHLALGNVPRTLPHLLVHLKYLSTCIDFNSKEEVLTVMSLIRKSPRLKKVEFQCRPKNQQTAGIGTMGDFWKDQPSCCLEQVQVVSMDNIYGTDPEKEFMKFLLISLPNLQTMTIRPRVWIAEGKLLRDLLRFQRASKQAKVIFL